MKYTTKIHITKSGHLIEEHRFTAEGREPRYDDDFEAGMVKYEAENFCHEIMDIVDGEYTYGPIVGEKYMIAEKQYSGPNGPKNDNIIIWLDNGEGWPGNSDQTIKQYHGWRGTTNDWGIYGRGVRECLAFNITGKRSKKIRIVYGPDLVADQD